jgi:tripartite-type tricarboxylate transporter receptor subunit TctC
MRRVMRQATAISALGLCVIVSPGGPVAAADDVAKLFAGKTVSLVVGLPPGTGYDIYTRVVSRHLGRHIPGSPNVVVQHMAGASGLIAANWIANIAPRDGTAIATFSSAIPPAPLLGNPAAKFDPVKLTWISNMDESAGICGVTPRSGIATFDDLLTKPSIFGASGDAGPLVSYPRAINNLLGAKIKVVAGYKGTSSVKIAMSRGEVHGLCGVSASTITSFWREEYETGEFRPIIQTSGKAHPALKGVPHINDYAKTKEVRQAFDLIFGMMTLGRLYVSPPGVPTSQRDALRSAFLTMARDPQFLADADRTKIDIDPMPGEAVEAFIAGIAASPPAVIERVKAALAEK